MPYYKVFHGHEHVHDCDTMRQAIVSACNESIFQAGNKRLSNERPIAIFQASNLVTDRPGHIIILLRTKEEAEELLSIVQPKEG